MEIDDQEEKRTRPEKVTPPKSEKTATAQESKVKERNVPPQESTPQKGEASKEKEKPPKRFSIRMHGPI